MTGRTIGRADLVHALRKELNLPQNDCAAVVEEILESVASCLEAGEPVKIARFGVFMIRSKNSRLGRNPKTGEEVPIPARRVVVFRPSRNLKHWTNHPEDLPRRPRPQLDLIYD